MAFPRPLRGEIASIQRDIIHPLYVGGKVDPRDRTLIEQGGRNHRAWEVYEDISRDPHCFAILQKRYMAVVGREWEVREASSSRADKKAADMVRSHLEQLGARNDQNATEAIVSTGGGFDQVCLDLLQAILYGTTPAEIIWDTDGKEIYPIEIVRKDLRRFSIVAPEEGNRGYRLRLLTLTSPYEGEPLPARKFIVHRYSVGGLAEDPWGMGLGSRLFFPRFFKSNSVKFWLVFADKWASPTAIAKYPRGASEQQQDLLLDMLNRIATDAGIVIPEETAIEFLEAQRSSSTNTYEGLVNFCNTEMSKVVLGETGTTDQSNGGGSRARDEVGNEVRIEIAKGDADLLSATLNRSIVRWITELNVPGATPPTVWRKFPELDEKFDRSGEAQIIVSLGNAGYKATQKWVAEKFEIDLEEPEPEVDPDAPPDMAGLMGGEPAPETPEGDEPAPEPAVLSEGQEPDAVDRLTQKGVAQTQQAVSRWKGQIQDLLSDSTSLEEVKDRLTSLYTGMDSELMGRSFSQSLILAELSGRYEIIQESAPDAELSEPLEFRNAPARAAKRAKPNCTPGKSFSCGYSCQSVKRQCRSELAQQPANYATYLQQQIKQLQAQLAAAAAPKPPTPGTVAEVDPKSIEVDPKRFQYKILGEHTSTGEVGSLSGVKKFDPNLAGVIQVWVDPADGKTYVVNGHNRLALGKRLGADKVTVRYLDVKDAREARAVGALTNVSEGRGTAIDAAKFFKDSGLTKDDLDRKGIPMREKIATDGIALSKLDDSLFRKVIDGEIPVERAAIVGGSGLDYQQQRSLMQMVDAKAKKRTITNEVLSELVDTVKASSQQVSTQFDLFGASQVVQDNAIERASLQAAIKKRLSREKKLFGTVGKSTAAQQLATAGNVIDVNSSQKVSREAGTTLAVFDQLKNQSGGISRAINDAATKVQNGGDRKKIEAELYKEILGMVQSGSFEEELTDAQF